MKKGKTKKIFALSILSLFLLSFLSATIMAADPVAPIDKEGVKKVTDKIFDPVKDMFSDWGEGNISKNVAKYLFFILLAILIYSILGNIGFLDGVYVRPSIAILISFLATAFITPEEIYLILTSYGAMGLILGAIIPFIILIYFSIQMGQIEGIAGVIIQKIIWIGFLIFLIYKLILGWAGSLFGALEFSIYLGVIILTLIFMLFDERVRKFLRKEVSGRTISKETEDQIMNLTAEVISRKKKANTFAGAAKTAWIKKTRGIEEEIKRLGRTG